MAAHGQRTASLPLPSICFPASPSPRQRRPRLPTPSARQECCSPSRPFRPPTQRFRAKPQSPQSWSFRSAPFPPVVHHFRRNLNPRFARYEKNPAPVPFQHPCEIVSREQHYAHHVDLKESILVRIESLFKRLVLNNVIIVSQYITHVLVR